MNSSSNVGSSFGMGSGVALAHGGNSGVASNGLRGAGASIMNGGTGGALIMPNVKLAMVKPSGMSIVG